MLEQSNDDLILSCDSEYVIGRVEIFGLGDADPLVVGVVDSESGEVRFAVPADEARSDSLELLLQFADEITWAGPAYVASLRETERST